MKTVVFCVVLVQGLALVVGCDGREVGDEYCGNGVCDADESVATCPEDCAPVPPTCGNGYCEAGETELSCPVDCEGGSDPVCGNGYCELGETELSCPNDCASLSILDNGCLPEDQREICLLDSDADGAFTGPGGGLVGTAVAIVGDADGDGYDDLLVGNPRSDLGGFAAGAVYLLYGRPGGWGARSQLMDADAIFVGTRVEGSLGGAVSAAGDVNGDGYADLLIAEPDHYSDVAGAGVVYVLPGGPTRYEGFLTLSPDSQEAWLGEARFRDLAVDGSAGHALSPAGDVDGDGLDDFLIGAPGYGSKVSNVRGAAYLVYGGFEWAPAPVDLATEVVTMVNDVPDSEIGFSVSGGSDVNGDGYADLLIGHPELDVPVLGGAALLLYGGPERLPHRLSPQDADARFHSPNEPLPLLGLTVAVVGDVDADGFGDLLIGAPWEHQDVGFLFYGRAARWSGPQDVALADAALQGSVTSGAGPMLAGAGDVNGDGFGDFLVHGNDTSSLGQGLDAVYLFLGGSARLQGTLALESAFAVFLVTPDDLDSCPGWAGSAVAGGGDVNGDGLDDFLIGASGFCCGGDHSGFVYLVLGSH
ncbi:MAG: integrin alpha [bacterium]